MLFCTSKHYESDGGSIFIKKLALELDAKIIYLNEQFRLIDLYIVFLDSRIGKLLSRLPFYEMILGTIFVKVFYFFYEKQLRELFSDNHLVIPSDKFFVFRIVTLLNLKNVHFICLDLPWTYKNSRNNNDFIKLKTLAYINDFSTVNVCTPAMRDELKLAADTKVFITYSGLDLYLQGLDNRTKSSRTYKLIKQPLQLVYAGNLRFLSELLQVVDFLEKRDIRFTIDVYSKDIVHDRRVNNCGFVSEAKLRECLLNYDFGIVPMSSLEHEQTLIQTSFPSKTFAYLARGVPILSAAPNDSGLVTIMNDYKIGINYTNLPGLNGLDLDIDSFMSDIYEMWDGYLRFMRALDV